MVQNRLDEKEQAEIDVWQDYKFLVSVPLGKMIHLLIISCCLSHIRKNAAESVFSLAWISGIFHTLSSQDVIFISIPTLHLL